MECNCLVTHTSLWFQPYTRPRNTWAYQIIANLVVCSTACSGQHHKKHQSSVSLVFCNWNHRWSGEKVLSMTFSLFFTLESTSFRSSIKHSHIIIYSWWRHQMETCSASLTLCEGIPVVTGVYLSQRPVTMVTRSFDVFFDLHLNKRLSKQRYAGDLRRHRT